MPETEQPLAFGATGIVDLRRLGPAQIETLRREALTCPVCRRPGRIVISEQGPVFAHEADHEPETPARRQAKGDLLLHLRKIIFPQATVAADVLLPGGVADLAVVRPNGTRIAIRLAKEVEAREIEAWEESLRAERIQPLWLFDAGRLPEASRKKEESEFRPVSYRSAECALLQAKQPLLYYQPRGRRLHLVEAQPELRELAEAGLPSLGQVSSLIRRFRLSGLRVKAGRWWIDEMLYPEDLDLPARPLPKRIQKKLEELRLESESRHSELRPQSQ